MKINFKECNSQNFMAGRTQPVKYLVIHYTSNNGDTAKNNADYFAREKVGASAHYFCDESEIWQSVKDADTAWHCGAKTYNHPECRNSNSIGIEICMNDKSGKVRQGSIDNAVTLVHELMEKYNIPAENVIRHYDVTGKNCPAPMVSNPSLWTGFKNALKEDGEEMVKRYNTVKECPDWAQETVKFLVGRKFLNGDDGGLNLSEDMLRILVILDRSGTFDN